MTDTQKWIESTINYLKDMKDYAVWDLSEIKQESKNAMKSIHKMREIAYDAQNRLEHYKKDLDSVYTSENDR